MLTAIWSSGSATRAVMCIASMRRSSRPVFSASRSASAKHCLRLGGVARRAQQPTALQRDTGGDVPSRSR